jgi:hypothetical protein
MVSPAVAFTCALKTTLLPTNATWLPGDTLTDTNPSAGWALRQNIKLIAVRLE